MWFKHCKLSESAYVKVNEDHDLILSSVGILRQDDSGLCDYAILLNDNEIAYYDLDCYESSQEMKEKVKEDLATFADKLGIWRKDKQ